MKRTTAPVQPAVSPEQAAYGRWLERAARLVFVVLAVALAAYVSGLAPLAVPLERLPALWSLPARQFLAGTGDHAGWQWLRLGAGEVGVLAAVALLLSVSILCLAALLGAYARRRDWCYLAIVLLQIAVLAFAASDVLGLR